MGTFLKLVAFVVVCFFGFLVMVFSPWIYQGAVESRAGLSSHKVEEQPEPWKVVVPGRPQAEFPSPSVLRQGQGEVVQVGDFVTLRKFTRATDPNQSPKDEGLAWIWLGFLTKEQTPFYAGQKGNFELDSAIVGMKTGTLLNFPVRDKAFFDSSTPPRERGKDNIAGSGGAIPMGDSQMYRLQTSSARADLSKKEALPYLRRQLNWLDSDSAIWGGGSGNIPTTLYQIEKRCPAELRVRRIQLQNTGAASVGHDFDSHLVTETRRIWAQEAELLGQCADGTRMSFRYGPISAEPPTGAGLGARVGDGHWDSWFTKAWQTLPLGIQIDPPPADADGKP